MAALERHGKPRHSLEHLRRLIDRAVPDCLVNGYEPLIESINLPDPDDRHVVAAAIVARADVIVTTNLKDFPVGSLDPYGLEAQLPDEFVAHLFDLNSQSVLGAVRTVRSRLKNPPMSAEQYIECLRGRGFDRVADLIRLHGAEI